MHGVHRTSVAVENRSSVGRDIVWQRVNVAREANIILGEAVAAVVLAVV
jgi:hypothetical protein